MPRPPRKRIPFQPVGSRVNESTTASSISASKGDYAGKGSLRGENENVRRNTRKKGSNIQSEGRNEETYPPQEKVLSSNSAAKKSSSHNVNSSQIQVSKPEITSNSRLSSGSLLRRQSTARVASSISPKSSLILEPTREELALDNTENISLTNDHAGDSFPSFATAPTSRRPSICRPPTAPPSAVKPQATPSFLGNFKRRPRQPSILRMVQQQSEANVASPNEKEGSTTFFSLDRSLVAESSPRQLVPPKSLDSGGSRKRKRSSAASSRKAGLRESSSPSVLVDNIPSDPADFISELRDDVQIPTTARDNQDELLLHEEELPASPTPNPSPSSSDLAAAFTTQRKRARSRLLSGLRPKPSLATLIKTPEPETAVSQSSPMTIATSPLSLPSSSPSKQPQAANKRQRRDNRQNKLLRTADLQTLLPRGRLRGRRAKSLYNEDEFDIVTSSSMLDEDPSSEVSNEDSGMWPARGRKTTAASAVKVRALSSKNGGGQAKVVPLAAATTARGRTYSRRESDYEDDAEGIDDDDDTDKFHDQVHNSDNNNSPAHKKALADVRASDELRAAALQFQEVDEWELSFESCDVGGSSANDSNLWR